jgi:hypothetical protein
MPHTASSIRNDLRSLGSAEKAQHSSRFFKTGRGEYGEGDRFLGIPVPVIRKSVRKYKDAPVRTIMSFVRSPYHEERLFGILSLVDRYRRGDDESKKSIFDLYLDNTSYINNWDLVDSSAHFIVGPYLQEGSRKIIYRLAKSKNLWERRIAIIATYHYIKANDYSDTLALAEILRDDPHDLMYKAVGWMLREVGNRDRDAEEEFLRKHYRKMPRTMLRYAIEKFPEGLRKSYLAGRV